MRPVGVLGLAHIDRRQDERQPIFGSTDYSDFTGCGCTQGTGEAEVQGDADAPTEATVDIALRRQRNGMGGEFVVREPTARGFGEWCGEGEAVVLIESLGMGDKGIEIKGRELVGRKR